MEHSLASAHGGSHREPRELGKATEALKREHRIIERALAVLEELVEGPRGGSLARWEKVVDFLRIFADKCHHLKEEKILFPALEERGIARDGGPIGVMLMEHEEGRGYVRLMEAALTLAEEDPEAAEPALIGNAKAYLRLLREHIPKEDRVLFAMADAALTDDEQQKLLRQFEEHEALEMGPGAHEKYLALVRELEGIQ